MSKEEKNLKNTKEIKEPSTVWPLTIYEFVKSNPDGKKNLIEDLYNIESNIKDLFLWIKILGAGIFFIFGLFILTTYNNHLINEKQDKNIDKITTSIQEFNEEIINSSIPFIDINNDIEEEDDILEEDIIDEDNGEIQKYTECMKDFVEDTIINNSIKNPDNKYYQRNVDYGYQYLGRVIGINGEYQQYEVNIKILEDNKYTNKLFIILIKETSLEYIPINNIRVYEYLKVNYDIELE